MAPTLGAAPCSGSGFAEAAKLPDRYAVIGHAVPRTYRPVQILEAQAARALPSLNETPVTRLIVFFHTRGGQRHHASAHYAERAYLEYALSGQVKGQALPDVSDGQVPGQLSAWRSSRQGADGPVAGPGLHHREAGQRAGRVSARRRRRARALSSALRPGRLRRDWCAWRRTSRNAFIRSRRRPGKLPGSRDGDGAAAMRYTEARSPAPISRLLLDEIDEGTVDFTGANYDAARRSSPGCCRRYLPVRPAQWRERYARSALRPRIPSQQPARRSRPRRSPSIRDEKLAGGRAGRASCRGLDFPGGGQIITQAPPTRFARPMRAGAARSRSVRPLEDHSEDLARGPVADW